MKGVFFSKRFLWSLVAVTVSLSGLWGAPAESPLPPSDSPLKNRIRRLTPGADNRSFSLMEWESGIVQKEFRFQIPKGCFGFTLSLQNANADFSLKAALPSSNGAPEIWKESNTPDRDKILSWDCFSAGEGEAVSDSAADSGHRLPTGEAKAVVSVSGETLSTLPRSPEGGREPLFFFLSLEWIEAPPMLALKDNQPLPFRLTKSNQFRSAYSVSVSTLSAPLLVGGVADSPGVVLCLHHQTPAWSEDEADYSFALTADRREWGVAPDSPKPLTKGEWWLTLLKSGEAASSSDLSGSLWFRWLRPEGVTLKPLRSLPVMEGNELEHAMSAVVGITSGNRTVCGVFISEKGHILTALSAVSEASGRPFPALSVCVSPSVKEPPVYAFSAEVIETDPEHDLALLALKTAAYGQTIPDSFSFPCLQVATDMQVETGQPITLLGFPSNRFSARLSTVVAALGAVGGFEQIGSHSWFKVPSVGETAGGVAINVFHEVVGVNARFPHANENASVLPFTPTAAVPKKWLTHDGL